MLELISVHVPKCAGTSFQQALDRAYTPEAIFYDYTDRPGDPASPMHLDPEGFLRRQRDEVPKVIAGKKVAHGHLYIRKYDGIKAAHRITFLRHPVDRAISQYFYWLKLARHGHKLHDYFLDNQLSLLEFARLPLVRYLYTRAYFREVDMGIFDFIGSYENIEQNVQKLGTLLGKDLRLERVNVNRSSSYEQRQREIQSDKTTLDQLRASLAEDVAFYETALQRRQVF
jgi:hypothetical protein